LQFIESIHQISHQQKEVHCLSQDCVSAFFVVQVSASENLEHPNSKSSPDDEEIAKFDSLVEV